MGNSEAKESVRVGRKRVFEFHEGSSKDKILLGNKGANLCEMTRMGLPVPPGFVISTEACLEFFHSGKKLPQELDKEYIDAILEMERKTKRIFGSVDEKTFPLLLSVRSGAAASMPGFVYDTYRRFLQMFGSVVLGVDESKYEDIIAKIKECKGIKSDLELTSEDLKQIAEAFKEITHVPSNPWEQLRMAIEAVFRSWFNPRAQKYRKFNNIPETLGTAVTIQAMVFGNMDGNSGSGVAFTRNPGSGEKIFYGEYLVNAEGEDVVAGTRTPMTLMDLKHSQPHLYDQLYQIQHSLETHFGDMQDIEFTIESGLLFILQTRTGKRTARASVKIAVDMVREGLLTRREALLRIDAAKMSFFLHRMIDPAAAVGQGGPNPVLGRGLPASAGAAIGRLVFRCEDAEALEKAGDSAILARLQTSPEDIGGLKAAAGVVTMFGGMTSHAAVVARGMGKCAITGAGGSGMVIDEQSRQLIGWEHPLSEGGGEGMVEISRDKLATDRLVLHEGEVVTLDGTTGLVYKGAVPTVPAVQDEDYNLILQWADQFKRMKVFVNAETPEDVKHAVDFGAEGLGLCRTEHMFFHKDRIDVMRAMILSNDEEERRAHLDRMQAFQEADLTEVFQLMAGKEVVVRLLDPPLHEFLPSEREEVFALADRLHMDRETCLHRVQGLREANPMLGFRGCRVSVVHPEITAMQTRAIIRAAITAMRGGVEVKPEIMIPLVCTDHELEFIVPTIRAAAEEVFALEGARLEYKVGTMLEVPRACVRAGAIAAEGDVNFVSFGSNDLTQLMFGFSRDDAERFLPKYLEHHILPIDPFITIDERGVGALIQSATEACRNQLPRITAGVCGEHGGDPVSIGFFDRIGLDYVSCSPFRVHTAKIAAAQAHIRATTKAAGFHE